MRRFSRAEMAQLFNHMYGELLPGALPQGINELSTSQRYTIGSRLQVGPKVYHYAHVGAGATGLAAGLAAKVKNQQDIGFNAIAAGGAAAAGALSLLITVGATDGPAQDGSFPINYMRGGTVIVRTAATNFNRGIVGHPAKAAGAGTLLITLDAPTPVDVIVGNQVEAIASRYAEVVHGNDCVASSVWTPVAGIPTIDAPAGNYTWLQTWGPCCCIGAGGDGVNNPGGAANSLSVYANGGDGALRSFSQDAGIQQYVGYIIATGGVAGTQGAPFVNLMLDP